MKKREVKRAALIHYTAEIEGVSPTSVRRVLNDTQNNEEVFLTYLTLEEEVQKTIESVKLVRSIEKLIPFYNENEKDTLTNPPTKL